ncbi:MAG: CinA family protein [Burkholderiales bacterium]
MDDELYVLAQDLGQALQAKGWMVATAESCTGGWIGQAITMVPGSSAWFDRGFITYTNRAKMEMLGVSAGTLRRYGAVSEQTVAQMVSGALERSSANIAVAVSGVAGPSGGMPEKPVGTVCLAWGVRNQPAQLRTVLLPGDRDGVRRQTVASALRELRELAL